MKALLKPFLAFLLMNCVFATTSNAQIIIQDLIIFRTQAKNPTILESNRQPTKYNNESNSSLDNNEDTEYVIRDGNGSIVKSGVTLSPNQVNKTLRTLPKGKYLVEFQKGNRRFTSQHRME